MMTTKRQTAAESAQQVTVKSRDTGKVYRVIREYRNMLLVTPAWKKSGIPFTLPKTSFEAINPPTNNPKNNHDNTMISDHTKAAITALLSVDKTATDDEREAVAMALQGKQSGPAVLTIKEVCDRIGRTRQTVYNLVRKGLLVAVNGGKNNTGITTDSLTHYLKGA